MFSFRDAHATFRASDTEVSIGKQQVTEFLLALRAKVRVRKD